MAADKICGLSWREAASLQFITHFTLKYSYADSARMALEGGCRWIQLRMKECSENEVFDVAKKVKQMCSKYSAVFIIDDYVGIAGRIGAHGVHLGLNDMPISKARQILGSSFIIGGTANTFAHVQAHVDTGADYIGCGPYRFTTTKQNLSPVLGADGYTSIVRRMHMGGIRLPIIAIGGIAYNDIPQLLDVGIDGVALSGSVLRAKDPVAQMQQIVKLIHNKYNIYETFSNCRP